MTNPIEQPNMAKLILVFCCLKHKEERYDDVTLGIAKKTAMDQGWCFNTAIDEDEPWCSYRDQ